MNPVGVIGVSIVGLLAVWLYLNHSDQVQLQQTQQQAEMRCQQARFDVDFAKKWGDGDRKTELKDREKKACGESQAAQANTQTQGAPIKADQAELKATIGNMMK